MYYASKSIFGTRLMVDHIFFMIPIWKINFYNINLCAENNFLQLYHHLYDFELKLYQDSE